MGRGKKGGANNNKEPEKPVAQSTNAKKVDPQKEEQMSRIMTGINNMELDNENFIDTVAFDQSKAILDNAIEDLNHYLKLFHKGDYKSFPRVKVD